MNQYQSKLIGATLFDDGRNLSKVIGATYALTLIGMAAAPTSGGFVSATIVAGVLYLLNAKDIIQEYKDHDTLKAYLELSESPTKCPLDHVDSIKIKDKDGLEGLLARTEEKEELEWGSVLKAYAKDGEAVVYEIMDSRLAEEKKVVRRRRPFSVIVRAGRDHSHASKLGYYGGIHHFHPSTPGMEVPDPYDACNMIVSSVDRMDLVNRINLLSFNMPYGPEIIGYNTRHTYLPTNDEKTEYVKATWRDIYNYLGKK